MANDKVVFDRQYRDEYAIVSGLAEGTDVSSLLDADKFSTRMKVTVQRYLDDQCKVTITLNGHDNQALCRCAYQKSPRLARHVLQLVATTDARRSSNVSRLYCA
jgi:hypothetical protein